jgi:hypothetical protein
MLLVMGTNVNVAEAVTDNCITLYGEKCYAVSRYWPIASEYSEGVSADFKAYDKTLNNGQVGGTIWSKTPLGGFVETGWIDYVNDSTTFYCGKDGGVDFEWPGASDNTLYSFKIEYSGANNKWDTDANGNTCSLTIDDDKGKTTDAGYEISYRNNSITDMVMQDKKVKRFGFFVLMSSSTGSHTIDIDSTSPDDYMDVTIQNNYYKTTHIMENNP